MARQTITSEFNSFVGGLITEASPLTFPGNAALDINNFNINKNGTISRRLGMDFEMGHAVIDSGVSVDSNGEVAVDTFSWENVGGDPKLRFIVVQTGNVLKFFDTSNLVVTQSLVHTHTFTEVDVNIALSATSIDGTLVVVGAGKEPSFFVYEDGVITAHTYQLKVRDTFGVEDRSTITVKGGTYPYPVVDLRDSANVILRPNLEELTQEHTYNLRNSTYAIPRVNGNRDGDGLLDPIDVFVRNSSGLAPSNADTVTSALFTDVSDDNDEFSKYTERFFAQVLHDSPPDNFESPKGHFIIDALARGTSRLSEVTNLVTKAYPDQDYSKYPIDILPLDKTPGGATVVGEYAGRAWYAGFSGEIIGGDSYSPRMSSYVLFSKLIASTAELGDCHQVGDPTSKENPDLLDTDGGFIRIDEAYGIRKLVSIGSGLVVVAENGVWAIVGGSDFGFTATAYKVTKVSNHGCSSPGSVVVVDDSVMYWGDDGIYQVGSNELGDLRAVNITNATIQKIYNEVSDLKKTFVQGHFDTYDRKVRWIYKNLVTPIEDTKELILDVSLRAFYKHEIPTATGTSPNIVALAEAPPFKTGVATENITDGGVLVLDGGVPTVNTTTINVEGLRELLYLTLLDTYPTVTYTLSKYSDSDFIDWKTYDGVGVDSPAVLTTGYNGGGDFQRYKQAPYITFHFEKTEDGFSRDGLGDIHPTHESSCKVQSQWEWANSAASGRWGKEFQAYRHKRAFIPQDSSDPFDNGFSTVVTKNKLRGKGKVLSLHIKTEPLKDCKLLGWSIMTSVANNV